MEMIRLNRKMDDAEIVLIVRSPPSWLSAPLPLAVGRRRPSSPTRASISDRDLAILIRR
jgi:hypothetical protein